MPGAWSTSRRVSLRQEHVAAGGGNSAIDAARCALRLGAQVQLVSRNGTNDFHGSAIYKHGDPGLNAFNKYGGPGGASPTRVGNKLRQFGGSVGGPILKENLFFFFSYEGLRVNNTDVSGQVFIETSDFRDQVIAQEPDHGPALNYLGYMLAERGEPFPGEDAATT